MRETDILRACLDWLHAKGIFAWRQNQGAIPLAGGGFRRFSGLKGVSDILGILPQGVVVWTKGKDPEGKLVDIVEHATFGNFLAIEVKGPKGRLRPEQKEFLDAINSRGGLGLCVYSVEELERELAKYLP